MGKKQFERDISGMRLFGRCKFYGNCVCGKCEFAPANTQTTVLVTKPSGESETITAPLINEYELQPRDKHSWNNDPIGNAERGVSLEKPASQIDKFNRRAAAARQQPMKRRAMPPMELQNRKRCPDCNVLLRKDHKCKFGLGQNGPVVKRDPLPKAAAVNCPKCGEGLETLAGHVCYQSIETMEDTRVPGGRVNLTDEAAQLPGGEPITDTSQSPAPDPDAIPLPEPKNIPGYIIDKCKNGHLRTLENVYIRPDGRRDCRICRRICRINYRHKSLGEATPNPEKVFNQYDSKPSVEREVIIALPGIEITIRPIRPGATRV